MKDRPPLVSVVVTTLNEEPFIAACLRSLVNQTYLSKQIIVVDGGSSDATVRIASTFQVEILHENKKGPAAGRNRGIVASRGEIIAFTDADCTAQTDWLENIVEAFHSSAADVVGGSVETRNRDSFVAQCIGARFEGRSSFATWNVSYLRKVIEAIGMFDEHLIAGEDVDLALRAEETGHRLHYEPALRVQHDFPTTIKDVAVTWFRYGFYWPRLLFKHPARTYRKVLLALVLVSSPLVTIVLPALTLPVLVLLLLVPSLLYYSPLALQVVRSRRSIRYVLLPLVHSLKLFVHLTAVAVGLFVAVARSASS